MIKLKELLTEDKLKPSLIKKVQAFLKKELRSDIKVISYHDGAIFRASEESHGINIDYQNHDLYGDTFEIYLVGGDRFATGGSAAHINADSEKDALKAVMTLAKKQKKLLQK